MSEENTHEIIQSKTCYDGEDVMDRVLAQVADQRKYSLLPNNVQGRPSVMAETVTIDEGRRCGTGNEAEHGMDIPVDHQIRSCGLCSGE